MIVILVYNLPHIQFCLLCQVPYAIVYAHTRTLIMPPTTQAVEFDIEKAEAEGSRPTQAVLSLT